MSVQARVYCLMNWKENFQTESLNFGPVVFLADWNKGASVRQANLKKRAAASPNSSFSDLAHLMLLETSSNPFSCTCVCVTVLITVAL